MKKKRRYSHICELGLYVLCVGLIGCTLTLHLLDANEAVPAATAADIVANPSAALEANKVQAESMLSEWLESPWLSWGLAASILVLGITRRVLPGLWGMGANILYNLAATAETREAAKRKRKLADVGDVIIRVIEDMPEVESVKAIKYTIRDKIGMDEELESAIQETIAKHRSRRAIEKTN